MPSSAGWPKCGDTLIELCVTRERLSAIFNVIFVIGGRVFAEGSAIEAVFDDLSGKLEGDGLELALLLVDDPD